jgi:GDP/UDP-N,N'-diacetylbacillosamine 2-epimerase (hydrolysing)
MTRRICYFTGSRADFGLMRATLRKIQDHPRLSLTVIVTGTHLSTKYGLTVNEIADEGFEVIARVPVDLQATTGATMARNIGIMLGAFVEHLERARPDVVLLLGDRGEMLAGAIAAIHLNIPIAHVHGGERSGNVDEPIRHAVSKLSHLHFAATQASSERLIRLGERPDCIWVTGAPGLDDLAAAASVPRAVLMRSVGFDSGRPVALFAYHPVLADGEAVALEAATILDALRATGCQVIGFWPNSDGGAEHIRTVLIRNQACSDIVLYDHLPRTEFVSWMAAVDVMIGNSSAGIIEAATFDTPVINVGTRQRLRERNGNVTDVGDCLADLTDAIRLAFNRHRQPSANIYGDGNAGTRIAELLATVSLPASLLAKSNAF